MMAVNDLPSGGQKMGSMTLRFKSAGLLLQRLAQVLS
jgi:hypothetical protein